VRREILETKRRMKTAVIALIAAFALMGMASAKPEYEPEYHPWKPYFHEKKCSYYADQYEHVKIYDYENKKCYPLLIGGKWGKVGFVCTSIVDYHGKKCIKFYFYAADGYKFYAVKAGADANCAYKDIKYPFQAKAYGLFKVKTLYVCLNEFYAYPGENLEGCCNSDICLFIKVIVKKWYCESEKSCNWLPKKIYASPPTHGYGCSKYEYDYFTRCSVPLICKDHIKLPPVPEIPGPEEPVPEIPVPEESPMAEEPENGVDETA